MRSEGAGWGQNGESGIVSYEHPADATATVGRKVGSLTATAYGLDVQNAAELAELRSERAAIKAGLAEAEAGLEAERVGRQALLRAMAGHLEDPTAKHISTTPGRRRRDSADSSTSASTAGAAEALSDIQLDPRLSLAAPASVAADATTQVEAEVEVEARPDFNGVWLLMETEGLDGYLKALGTGWVVRTAATTLCASMHGSSKQEVCYEATTGVLSVRQFGPRDPVGNANTYRLCAPPGGPPDVNTSPVIGQVEARLGWNLARVPAAVAGEVLERSSGKRSKLLRYLHDPERCPSLPASVARVGAAAVMVCEAAAIVDGMLAATSTQYYTLVERLPPPPGPEVRRKSPADPDALVSFYSKAATEPALVEHYGTAGPGLQSQPKQPDPEPKLELPTEPALSLVPVPEREPEPEAEMTPQVAVSVPLSAVRALPDPPAVALAGLAALANYQRQASDASRPVPMDYLGQALSREQRVKLQELVSLRALKVAHSLARPSEWCLLMIW
jgi:hypothetical protein